MISPNSYYRSGLTCLINELKAEYEHEFHGVDEIIIAPAHTLLNPDELESLANGFITVSFPRVHFMPGEIKKFIVNIVRKKKNTAQRISHLEKLK